MGQSEWITTLRTIVNYDLSFGWPRKVVVISDLDQCEALTAKRRSRAIGGAAAYRILDTPPDGAFDHIAELAAGLFRVPIALVSLVDHDRVWFKSHRGLEDGEVGREAGLCASAILSPEVYHARDAAHDRVHKQPAGGWTLSYPFLCGRTVTYP